jgi:ParB family chromosome partitioning protein
MPKNGAWIEIDEYGREKLPPRANRTWAKPKKGDQIGFAIDPRNGTIHEVVFRIPEPDVKTGKDSIGGGDDAPTPKKTRPEITQKGTEIIGALRTEALVKSLEVNSCDDMTLIGLLVLALDAKNVSVQTDFPTHPARTKLVQSITEGGRLTHDTERLRVVARQMLATVLSCSLGRSDSGLVARIAGDALGADAHIGNMATEDFLRCLSKAGIEKVGSALRVLPRPRAKDTRAEVIKQASGATYVHPAALFALTEAELALHAEAPREYPWSLDTREDDQERAGDEAGETEGDEASAPTEGAGCMPSVDPDDLAENGDDADENAHLDSDLDEDEAPVVPMRSRPTRRNRAAAP